MAARNTNSLRRSQELVELSFPETGDTMIYPRNAFYAVGIGRAFPQLCGWLSKRIGFMPRFDDVTRAAASRGYTIFILRGDPMVMTIDNVVLVREVQDPTDLESDVCCVAHAGCLLLGVAGCYVE